MQFLRRNIVQTVFLFDTMHFCRWKNPANLVCLERYIRTIETYLSVQKKVYVCSAFLRFFFLCVSLFCLLFSCCCFVAALL